MAAKILIETTTDLIEVGTVGPQGPKGDPGASNWNDIQGKPTTFPPSAHQHVAADVTDAVATSDARLSDARTPTAHKSTHATGGSDALTPADIGAANASHAHTASQISDSTTAGRALLTAADAAAQRTSLGLGTAATANSTAFAAASHTHTPSEVGLGNVTNAAQVTSVTGTAPIVSSGGTTPAISINAATTSAAGSMSAADKLKLDGIAANATANSSDATLLNRANHTGTQAASTITGLAAIATSASASDLTTGTVATARLGSGSASASTYLRGDQTWASIPPSGVSAMQSIAINFVLN